MAKHGVPLAIVPPIKYTTQARNGTLVQASLYSRIARGTNHCLAYHRKWLAKFAQSRPVAGQAATVTGWRAHIHTGHHCKQIRGDFVLARPDNAAAADPYINFKLLNASTGAVVATSNSCRYGPVDSGAADTASEMTRTFLTIDGADFSDDSDYWLQVYAYDYARILSCSFFERGTLDGQVDDTITGAVDPRFAALGPITDDPRLAIAEAQTEIIRTNRQPLITWATYDGSSKTHTGDTTWTNMLDDSSTTVSVASPGWYINNQYRNTVSKTGTPVVVAVYAKSAGLGGTRSDFRLTDGTNTIDVGPVTTEGWYTATGTIAASAGTKFDVHGYSDDATRTAHLYALSVYEYE